MVDVDVVGNKVEQDGDAVCVGCFDELLQVFHASELRIGLVEGGGPVAVVGRIVAPRFDGFLLDLVGVLIGRREPDGGDAEFLEVALFDLLAYACPVAAAVVGEGEDALVVGGLVEGGVAVLEAVGHGEVDDLVAGRAGGVCIDNREGAGADRAVGCPAEEGDLVLLVPCCGGDLEADHGTGGIEFPGAGGEGAVVHDDGDVVGVEFLPLGKGCAEGALRSGGGHGAGEHGPGEAAGGLPLDP
jgi:hypothetical protein